MLPAGSKAGVSCLGVPDTCKVPVPPPVSQVPTPFPNNGMVSNAMKTSMKVKIENMDTVVEMSEIPNSDGDQPGSLGGVVSGMVAGPVTFKLGSSRVKAEGKGIVFQTALTAHNGTNANAPAGLLTAVAQVKVLVSP